MQHPGSSGQAEEGVLRPPFWLTAGIFLLATVILYGEFIFSNLMLYGEDTFALGYMARAFLAERITGGDFPLWAPRLLGGVPMFEAISGGDFIYPTSLLYFLTDAYRALGWKLVLHVLAGGFFMYGWARSLGLGRPASTVGGVAWLMAPVMVTLTLGGNDGKLMVASLTPMVFWAADALLRRPSGRTAAGLAGAVALTLLTTQFQTGYFLFGSVGAYAVFRTILMWREGEATERRHRLSRATLVMGVFLGSSLLGGALAAFQLAPAAAYVGEYSRRVATTVDATQEQRIAYATSWSFHPEEVLALAVPEFVGNTAADASWGQGTYWGRNALKLNHEYLGMTVLVLALFGLLGHRRRPLRWFMGGLGALWLLYALGAHTPVWRIVYEIVPGMSLFRVPAIAAFLVSFGVVTLFVLGVEDLVRESRTPGKFLKSRRGQALLGFLGLLLLGLLLQASGVLTGIWTSTIHTGMADFQQAALARATPFITRGFGIALFLGGLAVTTVWAAGEGRISRTVALAALTILVTIDLGRIDRAFIRTVDFYEWAAPTANVRFLQERHAEESPFRVADMRRDFRSDQKVDLAMHGLDLLAGHHPNDLARYRMLLGIEGSQSRGANTRHPNVLRMMNVRYVVLSGTPSDQEPRPLSTAQGPYGAEAVYAFGGLGRAWTVDWVTVMEDDEAALARILSRDFDPGREAVLAAPLPGAVGGGGSGPVEWVSYEPDERELRVSTTGPALLVVSENWFPGWVAEVNGEPADVHRANLTLQAVRIAEAGEHTVTMRFTAPTVRRALWLSVGAAVVVLVLLASPYMGGLAGRLRHQGFVA
ncbi:MAG: hypothetical protein OXG58_05385 [Gemmatimonadetes bacterium]|nr:hypothetical protein [Gemmatimonadota bacterium]MCY3943086.1 hypothetical protein [Gemmatimonadota bacterium]